jgi:hypothetical protein
MYRNNKLLHPLKSPIKNMQKQPQIDADSSVMAIETETNVRDEDSANKSGSSSGEKKNHP